MSRETTPDLNDVFAVASEREQVSIRTIVPGRITAFSRNPRECSVQIDLLAQIRDGEAAEVPPIDRVPIVWPCGGGFAIDADLAIGEQVLVLICDRDISGWLPTGESAEPRRRLLHHIKNAVVLPGLRSINRQGKQAPVKGELYLGADTGQPPWLKLGTLPPSVTVEAPMISFGEGATALQGAARVGDPVALSTLPADPWVIWLTAVGVLVGTPPPFTDPIGNILTGSLKTRIE